MSDDNPTFFRLVRILQLVPREPQSTSTERIEQVLNSEGIDSTRRTIQRDLIKLEGMGFGLVCKTKDKPFRWCFKETADGLFFPGLDPQAALALRLAELHLERALPKSTLRALQPHLQAAKKALQGKPVAKWLDRVRLVPKSQPLVAPKIDGGVMGVVHEALLEGKQIVGPYKKRGATEAKEITLHPLGLVYRDSVAYLVATAFDYTDPRLFPLHRLADARMLADKAQLPAGFDLDAFIAKGELGFRFGDAEIDLELVFEKAAAIALEETPLAANQRLERLDDERVRVQVRLPDTQVLRGWILGFGAQVEVTKPAALRAAIGAALRAAAGRYPG